MASGAKFVAIQGPCAPLLLFWEQPIPLQQRDNGFCVPLICKATADQIGREFENFQRRLWPMKGWPLSMS